MCRDGTNDAPALAQSNAGVATNTGTQAARQAGNMVDLDSDPTKLTGVVGIGKQLLMTREALTTFSIANDVAKYFAILPAILALKGVQYRPMPAASQLPRNLAIYGAGGVIAPFIGIKLIDIAVAGLSLA